MTSSARHEHGSDARAAFILEHPDDFQGFSMRFPDATRDAWRSKRTRLRAAGLLYGMHEMRVPGSPQPVGEQSLREPATDEEWEAYFASLFDANETHQALSSSQAQTEWNAPNDGLPVGVLFTGDWHGGARGVLYRQLDADLDRVRETPGLYAVGMGDYHEGVSIHSKAAPALYSGLFNDASEQDAFVRLRLKRAQGKWLVVISGNHDEWQYKHAGLTRVDKVAAAIQAPHFGEGGGTVFANVGSQRYAIGVRHNTAGNSRINSTNPMRRMFDDWPEWESLHVAVIAHLHFNDLQLASRKGGRCVYLRSGTYKVADAYAKAGGFTPEYGTPLAILLPDEERVIPFRGDDIEFGLRYLAQLREVYAVQQSEIRMAA